MLVAVLALIVPTAAPPAFAGPLVSGRPLAAWLADLRSGHVLLSEEAVEVLGAAGEQGKIALPLLRRLGQHPNHHLRRRALVAAWKLGDAARPAALALSEALRDETTRNEALPLLDRMGADAAVAVPRLIALADDREFSRRVAKTLARIGRPAVPGLLAALNGPDASTRRCAALALSGPFAEMLGDSDLDAVAPALLDPQRRVRIETARLLYRNGRSNPTILAGLGEGLRDPALAPEILDALEETLDRPAGLGRLLAPLRERGDLGQRLRVARLIYSAERNPSHILPLCLEALDSTDHSHWVLALQAITEIGPAAKVALPRILDKIDLKETRVSFAVELALVALGKQSAPALVQILGDAAESSSSHALATAALGQMGPVAARAVLPLLADRRRPVRASALGVLASLASGAAEAVPALVHLIEDEPSSAEAALGTLARIGSGAAAARPLLVRMAGDLEKPLAREAMAALALIGTEGRTAQRLTRSARKSALPAVRLAGLQLLMRVKPDDAEIEPYFLEMLATPATRRLALEWVPELGHHAARLVPRLAELASGKDPSEAVAALRGLGSIGPAARAAMPALLEAARLPDRTVDAATAMVAIAPADKGVVPVLLSLIRMSDSAKRDAALTLLARLGSHAAPAFSELAALTRSEALPTHSRQLAGLALTRIDPARVRKESLLRGLGMGAGRHLAGAQAALLVDPKDPEPRRAFRSALRAADLSRRAAAIRAARELGPAARPLLPMLRLLLKDREPRVRADARAAFLAAGGNPKEAAHRAESHP